MDIETLQKLYDLGFPLTEVQPYKLDTVWPSFIVGGKKFYFPTKSELLDELAYYNYTVTHKGSSGLYSICDTGDIEAYYYPQLETALALYYITKKQDAKKEK